MVDLQETNGQQEEVSEMQHIVVEAFHKAYKSVKSGKDVKVVEDIAGVLVRQFGWSYNDEAFSGLGED